MPIHFPISFSPSGLTPEGFLICQLILVFHPFLIHQTVDLIEFKRVFFTILRDLHLMSPLFSRQNLLRINMFGSITTLLALRLCRSPHGKTDRRFLVSLARRLVSRKRLQVHTLEFQRLNGFSSYVSIFGIPPPVMISLDDKILSYFQSSKNCVDDFLFLLSNLPDPCALQSLVSSDNEDLQFAILCMVFRELNKNSNQLFFAIYYNDYFTSKSLFFRQSRTQSFRELNIRFRFLKRIFRNQLRPGMSHFDFIDWIYARFFQFMEQTTSRTWQFLRRVFSERSIEALYDCHQPCTEDDGTFQFQFQFSHYTQDHEAEPFLRKVNSLQITPKLIDKLEGKSMQHYDEYWKSILACGLFWIVSLSSTIQHGDSLLNYIFNYVIHARDNCMYYELLNLFLKGASGSEHSRFHRMWFDFNNMRGRYADRERVVFLAEVLDCFVKILNDPQFFSELKQFCTQNFDSLSLFEDRFLQFSRVLKDSPAKDSFARWFYPRFYVLCKNCNAQIRYSRHLKSIRFCEKCVKVHSSSGWDGSWSDDDD